MNGVELGSLELRLGANGEELTAALGATAPWKVGSRVVDEQHHEALVLRVLGEVRTYHAAHPLDDGAPMQWLRSRVPVSDEIASALIDDLVRQKLLLSQQGVVADAAFAPTLTPAQEILSAEVVKTLEVAGAEPPSVDELAAVHKASPKAVGDVLRWLARQGTLIQVEPDRYYRVGVVRSLLQRLESGMGEPREYSPSELREVLGFTRKFLIPFLEYCDREGYTIRSGLGRRLAAPFGGPRVR